MTSPISIFLRNFRVQTGLTQLELAALISYEQGYVSAIELGLKAPSLQYLERITKALKMGARDLAELETAMQQSKRRFVLPSEVPTSTYKFCNALWEKIEVIHPAVIDAMYQMLKVEEEIASKPRLTRIRIHRKQKTEATM